MKKKLSPPIKDGIIGTAIGTAIIVPGISGGTIALVFGVFKKIVNAVDNLFSKNFWKNLGILLPFLVGAIIAIAALIYPFQLAFKYCMFSIVCLFAGFIIGSIPGLVDEVRDKKPTKANNTELVIGFVVAAMIGIFSLIFKFNKGIDILFAERSWKLYVVIFFVGILGSTGLIVPGFSGSMLLMVIGFYHPIIKLVDFTNFWSNVSVGFVFALGTLVGFIFFSKLMNKLITKHRRATMFVVIGFISGSLVSIFVNSQLFFYLKDAFGLLDCFLWPWMLAIGLTLSIAFVRYTRKHKGDFNA